MIVAGVEKGMSAQWVFTARHEPWQDVCLCWAEVCGSAGVADRVWAARGTVLLDGRHLENSSAIERVVGSVGRNGTIEARERAHK